MKGGIMTECAYRQCTAALCLVALCVDFAAQAQTINYPEKPVTIIADAAPGSTPDIDARFCAEALTKLWGQQVIVVNHAGAFGSIAARAASEAPADGYTLFMPSLATFIAGPGIAPNVPLMLPRDFLPIGFTAENPMFIAASPTLGVSTLPEFIALAKKEPGKISIAATGAGRLTHLTGLLLQDRAGINLLPVPYNAGPAAALADVGSGRVSMIIEGYSGILGAVKAGQVKLLAVASRERLSLFPDLPTVSETIPDFAASGWQVLVAPPATPKPIIDKIAVDLAKIMDDPAFKEKLANIGSYSHAMKPAEALAFVDQQQKTWLPIVAKLATK
jgi:tripartite-type tricarboxylate transporter receptor subunit TctC